MRIWDETGIGFTGGYRGSKTAHGEPGTPPQAVAAHFRLSFGPDYKRPPRNGPSLFDQWQAALSDAILASWQARQAAALAQELAEHSAWERSSRPYWLPARALEPPPPPECRTNLTWQHIRCARYAGMMHGTGLPPQLGPVAGEAEVAVEAEVRREEEARRGEGEQARGEGRDGPGAGIRIRQPRPEAPPMPVGADAEAHPSIGMPRGRDGRVLPPPAAPLRAGQGGPAGVAGAGTRGGAGPVRQGQQGVQKAKEEDTAAGWKVRAEEMTVRTPKGDRRVDVVVEDQNGNLEGREVKTGDSPYKRRQADLDREIETNGGEAVGENAKKAGLKGPVKFPTKLRRYPR